MGADDTGSLSNELERKLRVGLDKSHGFFRYIQQHQQRERNARTHAPNTSQQQHQRSTASHTTPETPFRRVDKACQTLLSMRTLHHPVVPPAYLRTGVVTDTHDAESSAVDRATPSPSACNDSGAHDASSSISPEQSQLRDVQPAESSENEKCESKSDTTEPESEGVGTDASSAQSRRQQVTDDRDSTAQAEDVHTYQANKRSDSETIPPALTSGSDSTESS